MTPQHHLSPTLWLAYAGGAASDAEALVVASHLTFCAACRAELASHERLAGAMLERGREVAVPHDLLEATLAKLDERLPSQGGADRPMTSERRAEEEGAAPVWTSGRDQLALPRALGERLRRASSQSVGFLAPGMKGLDLPTSSPGVRLRLMRLAPGLEVPAHDHGGNEYTLVLSGAFQDDASRRFASGDLCVRESGEAHLQKVERGEPCFALQLNEGPLLPLTWKGRLLSALFDRPWSGKSDRL